MAQRKIPYYFFALAQTFKGRAYLAQATDFLMFVRVIWAPAGVLSVALCYFSQPHAQRSPIDPTVGGSSPAVDPQVQFASNRVTPGSERISDPRLAGAAILDGISALAFFRRFQ